MQLAILFNQKCRDEVSVRHQENDRQYITCMCCAVHKHSATVHVPLAGKNLFITVAEQTQRRCMCGSSIAWHSIHTTCVMIE
jgi:hypothetical protein